MPYSLEEIFRCDPSLGLEVWGKQLGEIHREARVPGVPLHGCGFVDILFGV